MTEYSLHPSPVGEQFRDWFTSDLKRIAGSRPPSSGRPLRSFVGSVLLVIGGLIWAIAAWVVSMAVLLLGLLLIPLGLAAFVLLTAGLIRVIAALIA